MANEEQLSILKQGVKAWNEWREETYGIAVDLVGANLFGVALNGAFLGLGDDLRRANLSKSNLRGAYLGGADLSEASLSNSDLRGANLTNAMLAEANPIRADFTGANLGNAYLYGANLSGANLANSDLSRADLTASNLTGANLVESNFAEARLAMTIFGNSDLSGVIGLEDVIHEAPSTIGIDTIQLSKGKIPDAFLRGCGLNDADIEYAKLYNPDLSNEELNKILYKMYELRATQALQISPLFISYSHADIEFVDKIGNRLDKKSIRYWRDIKDMRAGRVEKQVDRAIRQNPTVLLVLSNNSLKSDWVEHEVRMARGLEKEVGRDMLCPIALDESWKSSRWPKRIMEQIMEYNILDFSGWQDDAKFEKQFRKLIEGLDLFYRG